MLKKYVYKPDTCGCKVCQIHDTETDTWSYEESFTNDRGETYTTFRCSAHSDLSIADLFDVISSAGGENKRKNRINARLQEQWPGSEVVSWSFTGRGRDRIITVVTAGLTAGQKVTAQTWCNNNFGAGKVIVT